MMEKNKISKKKVLQAMRDACYGGDRFLFEEGDLKAAIVPIEDLEVLEEMEFLDCEPEKG